MCEVPEIVTISIDSRSVSDTTLRQTLHLTTYVSQIMMIVGCHNVHIGQQCETYKENMTYVTVLSLLEMHSGGNVRRPRCRPFSPGVLGASDLILLYYWGGLHSAAPTGGGPCSAVLRHLRAANTLVHV